MATTTNYGWTTPDDTALVKDGAAAIRTLGSSVDTTTKNLNPSTTLGDIEYRSSTPNVNTRLPLGTAGQVLKVNSGATAPEWATDASGMTNPMTTTGDTIYSSSGSTPARLGIGTAGQVLQVNSGATAPEWATPAAGGGMTLINTGGTTLSGSGVTISSIPSTYTQLYIVGVAATNSGAANLGFRLNGDTGSNYYYRANNNSTTTLTNEQGNVNICYIGRIGTNTAYNNICRFTLTIPRYADTAYKTIYSDCIGDAGVNQWWNGAHSWDNTAAITSFTILPDGNSFSGGTIYVYGVK
jgi:hypothetical protein